MSARLPPLTPAIVAVTPAIVIATPAIVVMVTVMIALHHGRAGKAPRVIVVEHPGVIRRLRLIGSHDTLIHGSTIFLG
jgi:hypothetical protein